MKSAKDNHYAMLDGVVIHYGSMPGGYIDGFNLGFTAVHEADTGWGSRTRSRTAASATATTSTTRPAEAEPTSGCPVGKDTCPREPGLDPSHNFMDYSTDPCYTQFTPGQTDRAQQQYLHWRVQFAS